MYLLNFEHWVSTVFVDAIGATFAHSLWQALIALIVCHVVLTLAKRSSPTVRYNLLLGVATLLAGAVMITFALQFNSTSSSKDILVTYVPFQEVLNKSTGTAIPVVLKYQYVLSLINGFLRQYMEVLVAVWFLVFCYKCLRLSIGLSYIKRIARFESTEADVAWLAKFEVLKDKLGITKKVALLQSNIVKVPLTSGLLKPIIIVPVSLFANMPAELIESILLHELAHIRRKDFLVNILQSCAETMFFFNPFISKISSLIRDERENCCDAMAVAVVKNKVSYVEALVAFSEYSNQSTLAVAFAGRRNYLLQRVKRILYNQNKKPGVMEKSILAFGVVLFIGLALFSTVNGTEKVLKSSFVNTFQEPVVTDTVPTNDKPSKREVKRAQRTIRDRQDKVERKQRELEEAVEDMERDIEKYHEEMGDEIKIDNQELQELLEKNEVNIDNDINLKENLGIDLEKIKPQIEKVKVIMQRQQQIMAAHADKFKAQQEQMMAGHADRLMIEQKHIMDAQAQQFKLQHKLFDSINKNFKLLHNNIKVDAHTSIRLSQHDEMDEVLQFLEKNNVAKVSEITSVTLNEKELIVNDKKQPASLHEQLRKKYLNKSGDFITYLRKGDTIMISMQVHEQEPV